MFARTTLCGLLLCATVPAGVPAAARAEVPDSSDAARIRTAVAQGLAMPLPRILDLASSRVPGEVLKVDLQDSTGRLTYEVKILAPNGTMSAIFLDAHSGAVLRIETR